MGGGAQLLGAQEEFCSKKYVCRRSDGRNLVTDWKQHKDKEGRSYAYITNATALKEINVKDTDSILGKL